MLRGYVLLLIVALMALAASLPARADISVGVRFGKSFLYYDGSDVSGRVILGDRYRHRHRRYRHHNQPYLRSTPKFGRTGQLHSRIGAARQNARGRRHKRQHYPYHDRHRNGRLYLIPERERKRTEVAPPPPEPEIDKTDTSAAPLPPPEPLDPAGSARLLTARGVALGPQYAVGDTLPSDQPYVILDPVRHGLPQPPQGEIYARVRREVFRIRIGSRQILEQIDR